MTLIFGVCFILYFFKLSAGAGNDTNHIGLKAYLPDTIVVYDYLMYPINSLVWWLVNQP